MIYPNKKAFIDEEGYYISQPLGNSMWPFIRGNKDLIVLVPYEEQLVKKGEILLYEEPHGRHVLHRVLKINEDGYLIRGDNCLNKEQVSKKQIIGVLKYIYRNKTRKTDLHRFPYPMYYFLWNMLYPVRFLISVLKRRLHQ